jgi:DTW domain-containing protein
MQMPLCICSMLKPLANKNRLSLIIHKQELPKPTNTGRIAVKLLQNSDLFVRGLEAHTTQYEHPEGYDSVVLYPSNRAVDLNAYLAQRSSASKPLNLIVPDGNWRQAQRIPKREPMLAGLDHVILPLGAPSTYRVRTEPKKPYGLATIEAIARAYGIMESKEVEQHLLHVFDTMIQRILWARGKADTWSLLVEDLPATHVS